jgi:tetratricopeptide (TPR) repeat protein
MAGHGVLISRGLLACALLRTGRGHQAVAVHDEALRRSTAETRPRILRAWAIAAQGVEDWQRALEAYDDLLAREPDDRRSGVARAICLLQLGRSRQAQEAVRGVVVTVDSKERPRLLSTWSRAAWSRGDFEAMANVYKLVLEVDPDDLHALHMSALLFAGAPHGNFRNAALAVRYAERVCIHRGWSDWKSISVLAAGYAEAGDFAEAVRLAEMALQAAPADEKDRRRGRLEQFRRGEAFRIEIGD